MSAMVDARILKILDSKLLIGNWLRRAGMQPVNPKPLAAFRSQTLFLVAGKGGGALFI
jgi:hypothetical protein